jgi:serine protease
MIKRYRALFAAAVVPALLAGCGEDYNFTEPTRTFTVDPVFTAIDEGTTLQLTATDVSGNPVAATWSSDNTAIATVNSTGLVTAGTPGVTAIIAKVGNESASSSITVNQLQGIALVKNVPVTGLSGATGTSKLYRIFVPAGTTQLRFTLSGGSGDADIYVRRGTPPTNASFTFFSFNGGNGELITVNNPQSGTWYVLVDAFETYAGATLTATYTP